MEAVHDHVGDEKEKIAAAKKLYDGVFVTETTTNALTGKSTHRTVPVSGLLSAATREGGTKGVFSMILSFVWPIMINIRRKNFVGEKHSLIFIFTAKNYSFISFYR